MNSAAKPDLTVAIGSLGAIGRKVAAKLDEGIPGLRLAAVSARDEAKARATVGAYRRPVPVVPLAELADHADVVVECAPAEVFLQIAEPALKQGRTLVVISVGALLAHPEVKDLAAKHGAQLVVPSGALLGLDAVQAAAEGVIQSVTMVTRKVYRKFATDGVHLRVDRSLDEGHRHRGVDGVAARLEHVSPGVRRQVRIGGDRAPASHQARMEGGGLGRGDAVRASAHVYP